MRIAVISDIHGNCVALNAALSEIKREGTDRIVCLGDTVQGGAEPAETVQVLRSVNCPIVMGNADAWLLNELSDHSEPTTEEQHEVRAWTLSKLSPADLEFIRAYSPTVEVDLGGQRLLCFHGSPGSYDDVLLPETPDEIWERLLGPHSPAIMAGGHTHTQQMRRVGKGTFFNPGSVGLAYNYHLPKDKFHADPWAEYAILTHEQGREGLEFKRAHYDPDDLVKAALGSGRPHADRMAKEYLE